MQEIYYEDWIIPDGFRIQVVQNHPEQYQRFFPLQVWKKYNVLRNRAGEVFALKMCDQVHVLYDEDDQQAVFDMLTKKRRTLSLYEKEFLDRRADTINLIGSAEELRRSLSRH